MRFVSGLMIVAATLSAQDFSQIHTEKVVANRQFTEGPIWSRDGSEIAFLTTAQGTVGIGVVRADGSDHRAFPVGGDAGRIAWAPDGRVMFSARLDGDYEIYVLHPVTGVVAPLTAHDDQDYRAVPLRYVTSAWRGFGAPSQGD